jgi:hypothetical protein
LSLQVLFLIPTLISLYLVLRGKVESAFLNVYLPTTVLVASYYSFRLPHLPELSAGTGALIPIAIAVIMRPPRPWRFTRMDIWVGLFIFSAMVSEVVREDPFVRKDAISYCLAQWVEMGIGYIVGRQLIEPYLRVATIKRIVFLFMFLTPFSLYEFRMGRNPWLWIGTFFFRIPGLNPYEQFRNGEARVASCFGHAITAGIMFMIVLALNYYLVQLYKLDKNCLGPWMSRLQKFRIPILVLLLFLYMTGSRMPQACTVLCFLFLQIPRFPDLRVGAIIVLILAMIGGGFFYTKYVGLTSMSSDAASNEAQTSAIYRKQMNEAYAPILAAGGWLGYGISSHPVVPGLESTDNNYLMIQLAQGRFGFVTFVMIAVDSVFTLVVFAFRFKSRESLFLVFSLMGAIIGIFVSLITVAMLAQLIQVVFLLVGWAQSLQDTRVVGVVEAGTVPVSNAKFKFKRVIA